ncbi:polysaccharide biosynthesis protein [uncultured Oscillibacter sp.]|uniref:putative polysaccharide biosynthesis protein n=1 Tax=uncultured Oscillibacter sp. TaxID=876091 RepID=UPI0025F19E43|nr:polysaccharide biosynthesis protein [uncultured Oscillibacter sp.]
MANQGKKQSFLGGAATLAGAVAVVKLIGAVYRLPVNNILSAEGKTYFNIAYNVYNVLLTISTAGLPLAISRLTSQAQALGHLNERRKLLRTAIWLFFGLGVVLSALMMFGSSQLAQLMHQPNAAPSILVLSPAVFCMCLLACMRGYTQGQGNMKPTAVSQVLEVLFKLGIGLPAAWYVVRSLHLGVDYGAAAAILGVTVSEVIALCFMGLYLFRNRDTTPSDDVPPPAGTLMRQVLSIGVPITLSNSAMSIITLLDTQIVLSRLDSISAQLPSSPAVLYGQYGLGTDLVNLPPSFVFPVTMSLIPFVAAALARQEHARANRVVSSALRLIALLAIPAGIGLSVLSEPILLLLYPAQPQDALACAPLLRVQGVACIFICLMNLTNAILQSYGREKLPIWTMIAGGVTKIVMNYFLVGNPEINIMGAPISTLCCYLVIAGLNLSFVWKYSPEKPRYLQIFAKPVIASLLMGVSAWAFYGIFSRALSGLGSAYLNNAAATMGAIVCAVVIYGVLVLALRILRAEDLESVPHGAKLAKILHLK